jgi:GNAT superfamily N-acetyltransferase
VVKDSLEFIQMRFARAGDTPALAKFCGQLGYPATAEKVGEWLRAILPLEGHAVFVAEQSGVGVVGWVHVTEAHHLMEAPYAEIIGLVVNEAQRSAGIGAALLQQAEVWARKRGLSMIWVRSNVIRERAHQFYLREGYQRLKTQHVFTKKIA